MLLSLFPQILFLAPLGTTLLRVAVAVCFAYMAWDLLKRRYEIAQVQLPIIGRPPDVILQFSSAVVAGIAVLLLIGAWTQAVALVAAVVVIKHLVFFKKYANIFAFSKSTYWLLLCICFMLVVTGAGAFAFDLPL